MNASLWYIINVHMYTDKVDMERDDIKGVILREFAWNKPRLTYEVTL